ncbi:carboxylesterase/lipase family protein [Hyphomonas sp.]|uniref:carboxylesterase/lipase family protein n=1 Tax=Hyphomonas sp. TaxID=87 RepID=UPI00391AB584
MPHRREVLLGLSASAAAGSSFAAPGGDPRVLTSFGPVVGITEQGIAVFRGLRYGADTARTRFARPRTPLPWRDAVRATEYGGASPQRGREPGQSEDCLFLNVWTPEARPGGDRPVMVYLHGGAYNTGSGSDALYEGIRLAARGDVVVVTVNHRLNAFGYLSLGRLMPEAFPDSGNAGQWDLVLALEWIRGNIRAFGGDPGRVMLFGQSGGGAKIATLMATPAAKGLFHAAATMSGQQVTASGPLNAQKRAEAFLARLGITPGDAAALLALPAERFIEALDTPDPVNPEHPLYFGPVLDERMLMRHPFWPDAPAQSSAIPMILGNTRDETRTLIGRREPELFDISWADLPAALARHMRTDIDPGAVVSAYRAAYPDRSPGEIFFDAATAARSWRGQVEEADARAKENGPTWVYRFDLPWAEENGRWGAPHTVDIGYAFLNLDKPGAMPGAADHVGRVADRLSGAFISLARTGDPNHSGLPLWPRYSLPARATMIFGAETSVLNDPRSMERELFSKVPFIQWGT